MIFRGSIAATIENLRHWRGLSQVALAEKIGVTQRAIGYYENPIGNRTGSPRLTELCKMSKALSFTMVIRDGDWTIETKDKGTINVAR